RRVLLEPLLVLLLDDDLVHRVVAVVERRLHDEDVLVRPLLRHQARHQRLRLAREHRARIYGDHDAACPALPACPAHPPRYALGCPFLYTSTSCAALTCV